MNIRQYPNKVRSFLPWLFFSFAYVPILFLYNLSSPLKRRQCHFQQGRLGCVERPPTRNQQMQFQLQNEFGYDALYFSLFVRATVHTAIVSSFKEQMLNKEFLALRYSGVPIFRQQFELN